MAAPRSSVQPQPTLQEWPLSQYAYASEKKEAYESFQQVSPSTGDDEETNSQSSDWKTGFFARFPWLGFGGLFIVLCCTAGAVAVLAVSDGESQTNWPQRIQPSVILSGLNNVANLCFSLAIANGVAIAWWRKALKGTTIEDLHKSWSFGSSIKEAALAGKAFNVIALAALTAKFTIIDGMLMQSATTTYLAQDRPTNVSSIRGWANQTIPVTQVVTSPTFPSLKNSPVTYDTRRDLLVWQDHPSQLPLTAFQNCEGLCFFKVPAAGFMVDCTPNIATMNMINEDTSEPMIQIHKGTGINSTVTTALVDLFRIAFAVEYKGDKSKQNRTVQVSTIKMDVKYAQSANPSANHCSGTIHQNTCTLTPAVLRYPVMMQNYTVGSKLVQGISVGVTEDSYFNSPNPLTPYDALSRQQQGFEFVRFLDDTDVLADGAVYRDQTQLGGLTREFDQRFSGTFNYGLTIEGGIPEVEDNANCWLMKDAEKGSLCGYNFDNPLNPSQIGHGFSHSLVASINQIMFAVATNATANLTATNDVPWETFEGILYKDAVHYKTRWWYAFGAVVSTLFCVLCVLPVYWGFWQLGRKVTLGPLEIAHAFRSPMTAQASSGVIEDVVKQVGHREVQYGQVVAGDARGVVGVAEPENIARLPGAPC